MHGPNFKRKGYMAKKIFGILLLAVNCLTSFAGQIFQIDQIEVQGVQRLTASTVLNYLPLKVGDRFDTAHSSDVMKALYETGFFDDVKIARTENKLVISVKERPIMSQITLTGNKELPKDKVEEALKKMGFEKGEIFNPAILEAVKKALTEQYAATGRFNTTLTDKITPHDNGTVDIEIIISEGKIAQVKNISIIGNKAFSESELLKELPLSESHLFSFFSGKDQYSRLKLEQTAEALRSYYLDRGYLNMQVDQKQVEVTADRNEVYAVFHITEGEQYRFSAIHFAGDPILSTEKISQLIGIQVGDIFSRQRILDANQAITNSLGDLGYAFAQIEVVPSLQEADHTVEVTFKIEPGERYSVRHITFVGNKITSNLALRNVLLQFEGAPYSYQKIQESIRNLRQLPYLKPDEITINPIKINGVPNQLDLEVQVAEQLSAQFNFSFGYSQAFGFLISTGLNQNNFLGTGKTAGFNFTRSAYQSSYSISYTNPFFTYEGVSRSLQVYYQDTNPGAVHGASYSTSSLGYSDGLGFPLTNYQRFNLGYNLQYLKLLIGDKPATQIGAFEKLYGTEFYQLLLNTGWDYNTLDRFQFPTKGMRQSLGASLSLPLGSKNLEYYTFSYQNRFYQPLIKDFILTTYGTAAYGNGYGRFSSLPFMQNYYAGGIGTTGQNRAFVTNTLGPWDSNGQPLGGNLLLSASIGMVFPTPLNKYNVRTSLLMDGGNVFNTQKSALQPPNPLRWDNLRYSYGVQLEWWTPLGMPLVFSLARPLNQHSKDELNVFQFNIGGAF